MSYLNSLIDYLNVAGCLIAVLLGLVLLTLPGRHAMRYLGAFVLVCASAIACIILSHVPGNPYVATVEKLEYVLSLSSGPLLLFFVRCASSGAVRLRWIDLLHFVPAIAFALYAFAIADTLSLSWRIDIRFILLHQVAYTAWSASLVTNRESALSLARWVVGFMVAIHLAQVVRLLGFHPRGFENVVPFVAAALFILIGFAGLRQSRLLLAKPRYGGGKLSDERLKACKSKLETAMLEKKLFRDPQLGLKSLARTLQIPSNDLSRVVNEHYGMSLTDYINSFRIAEARAMLTDPEFSNYAIEAIAQEVGFKARSTFYTAFKRSTGLSPLEFKANAGQAAVRTDHPGQP